MIFIGYFVFNGLQPSHAKASPSALSLFFVFLIINSKKQKMMKNTPRGTQNIKKKKQSGTEIARFIPY